MSIKYKLVPKKNPRELSAPEKYYAKAVIAGKDSTKELAKEISENSSLTESEIIHVLMDIRKVVAKRLKMGRSVDLLDICILSPSVFSNGVNSEKDFNAIRDIKKIGINIRPKKNLLDEVKGASLEKE